MYSLSYPVLIPLFLCVLLTVFLFIYWYRWRKKTLVLLGRLGSLFFNHKKPNIFAIALLCIALSVLIIGILDPHKQGKEQEIKIKGADIMVCLDVSNSMYAEDILPNRIKRAQELLKKMIDQLDGDRFGLVVFAGKGYLQMPLSTDYYTAKQLVDAAMPYSVPTQGTAIGQALKVALRSLPDSPIKNKSILLITDGEDHEEEIDEAVKEAQKRKIPIHTWAFGSLAGAKVPMVVSEKKTGIRTDESGAAVISRVNTSLLQSIASKTDGIFSGQANEVGMTQFLVAINGLEQTGNKTKIAIGFEHYFFYFVGLAILLLVIEFFSRSIPAKPLEN